ncbi:MAG: (2Fe-2S)-binding protein [Pararhodobacter sp.]|nr:(2Fe-2S)-binding protein [Pararhodobacter sp.]
MKAFWVLHDGSRIEAAVPQGLSLMEAAMAANVPGILGECGGTMSCATCHVVVDEAWHGSTGEMGDHEDAMLEITEAPRREGSRLSRQLAMSPAQDGITVQVPRD